jgi:adenosylcobinamide-GDP ribazoletransferase
MKYLLELRLAVAFLTRLPLPHPPQVTQAEVTACSRWFPLVGALIGAAAGAVHAGLLALNLPPAACAWTAIGLQILLTGALHEDGLADTADGFGGGRDRDHKLAILKDSRLGTYGAAALLVALGIRSGLIAGLNGPQACLLLAVAEGASRMPIPWLMRLTPPARKDGLGAAMGLIPAGVLLGASLLGLALLAGGTASLGLMARLPLLLAGLLLVFLLIRRTALRQIGGFTGDVLGALQQGGMLLLLALLSLPPLPWE